MGAVTSLVPGALPNQELEQIIDAWFGIKPERANIQPASFDVPISSRCYRLNEAGIKIPEGTTIDTYLRLLPGGSFKECDLSNGHVIAPNSTYLIQLEGKVDLPPNFFVRSSPKSTQGRLGTYVKLIGDGCPNIDEIDGPFKGTFWAIYETHAFHVRITAGDTLNQLRTFCRHPAKIEGDSLVQQFYDHRLLFRDGVPLDADKLNLNEGLPLTLDLKGMEYDGIVGFRARNNPEPIDLAAKNTIDAMDYFEVIISPRNGQIIVKPNEFYILYSREHVRVPGHLAMEMSPYHRKIGATRLHKAGFFDPYFGFGRKGELEGASAVLEVDSHEKNAFPCVHGQSAGVLEVQRLRKTASIVYGDNNNYQGQEGPRLAKQFKRLDFRELAETLDKNRTPIMVVSREKLFPADDGYFQGFKDCEGTEFYERITANQQAILRGAAEDDPRFKQPIPYLTIYCPETKRFFTYRRSADERIAPERRLYNKWSIGFGGHVRLRDYKSGKPLEACLYRERGKELAIENASEPQLLGFINDDKNAVGMVPFGLLYAQSVPHENAVRLKEATAVEAQWLTIEQLRALENKETWSTISLDPLERFVR